MDRPEPPLAALLNQVHLAVRQGDFAALPRLTLAMEAAEATAQPTDPRDLAELRRLAERNARTLIAARRGILAARRRIAEILSVARGLVTYDARGQRVEEADPGQLARRF